MMSLAFLVMLFAQPVYELDEIVVTATRYPLTLQNIAVATMVIDSSDIASQHALDIAEILHGSAGIGIMDYGIPGAVRSVMLRGVPSNSTLLLINGQPLNMMTTGMADLSVIDISAVERIEIVKGPVSSIYGANTIGGVVNIITTKRRSRPEIRVSALPFSTTLETLLQNKSLSVVLGLPLDRFQADVSGAYTSSSGRRSNSDLAKYDLQGAMTYHAQKWFAKAHILYDNKDYGVPGPMPRIDSLNPIPLFGDSTATSLFDHEKDATLLGNVDFTWNISERVFWEHRLFGDKRKTSFHSQYTGWIGDTIIEDNTYQTFSIGYNTMLFAEFSDLDITLGLDARFDSLRTETISEQSGDTVWFAQSYTWGTWCQAKKDLSNAMSLTPGMRLDYNKDFGSFFSPGIGFIAMLRPNLMLKASAGRTFRAPGFNDLYWPQSGNLDLTPEYGWAYEIRMETSPMPLIFAAVSLFRRDIMDRIAWMPDTGGLWKPQNINELTITGGDFEIRGQVFAFMNLSAEITYLSARQRNDEVVYDYYDWGADTSLTIIQEIERKAAFIPQYTLNFSQHLHGPYDIDLTLNELYAAERRNYYGNYDDYPNVFMDEKIQAAYLLVNASLTKAFSCSVRFTVGMKNVLDIDYATQFGSSFDDLDYPMPKRTYFLSIDAHY